MLCYGVLCCAMQVLLSEPATGVWQPLVLLSITHSPAHNVCKLLCAGRTKCFSHKSFKPSEARWDCMHASMHGQVLQWKRALLLMLRLRVLGRLAERVQPAWHVSGADHFPAQTGMPALAVPNCDVMWPGAALVCNCCA